MTRARTEKQPINCLSVVGATEAKEEDNKHSSGSDSPQGEAAVCPSREPGPACQTQGGGGTGSQGKI